MIRHSECSFDHLQLAKFQFQEDNLRTHLLRIQSGWFPGKRNLIVTLNVNLLPLSEAHLGMKNIAKIPELTLIPVVNMTCPMTSVVPRKLVQGAFRDV